MKDTLVVVTQVTRKWGPRVQLTGATLIIAGYLLEKKLKK